MRDVGEKRTLIEYLGSLLTLSQSITKLGRGRFFYACLSRALSLLLKMISLFLPLKVLIVMSSSRMPFYFDYLSQYIEIETILLSLVMSVPVVYFFSIVLGVTQRRLLDADLQELRNSLVSSYPQIKKSNIGITHNKLAIAFSEILLVIISLLLVLLISVYLFLVLFVSVLAVLILMNTYFYDSDASDRFTWFSLHRDQLVEYVSSCSFLMMFFLLVAGVHYFSLSIFSAVLSLLLSRMAFQSVGRFSRQSFYLKKKILLRDSYE